MSEKIVIKSLPAVVIKNSTFDLKAPEKTWDWDFKTHDFYKQFEVGQKMQSVKISDQKNEYSIADIDWALNHLSFWTPWKIVVSFEPLK